MTMHVDKNKKLPTKSEIIRMTTRQHRHRLEGFVQMHHNLYAIRTIWIHFVACMHAHMLALTLRLLQHFTFTVTRNMFNFNAY